MSRGRGGGQLEELAQQLQEIEAQREIMQSQITTLRSRQAEIDEAIEAIDELETGSTVQVPLGGEAYVRAEIEDVDEIVVSLGGGYATEQDQEGAREALETKHDTIDERIDDLQSEIAELQSRAGELEQRAQQMQQQQMQQLMEQQRQQQDDE